MQSSVRMGALRSLLPRHFWGGSRMPSAAVKPKDRQIDRQTDWLSEWCRVWRNVSRRLPTQPEYPGTETHRGRLLLHMMWKQGIYPALKSSSLIADKALDISTLWMSFRFMNISNVTIECRRLCFFVALFLRPHRCRCSSIATVRRLLTTLTTTTKRGGNREPSSLTSACFRHSVELWPMSHLSLR